MQCVCVYSFKWLVVSCWKCCILVVLLFLISCVTVWVFVVSFTVYFPKKHRFSGRTGHAALLCEITLCQLHCDMFFFAYDHAVYYEAIKWRQFSSSPNTGSRTRPQPAIDHYDAVNLPRRQHLWNALFDALHQLSGTHYRKLFSLVTLLHFLSLS